MKPPTKYKFIYKNSLGDNAWSQNFMIALHTLQGMVRSLSIHHPAPDMRLDHPASGDLIQASKDKRSGAIITHCSLLIAHCIFYNHVAPMGPG